MASERQPARSTTERGFAIYDEFEDTRGNTIRVQQSSSATHDAVWIFVGGLAGDADPAPHLDAEQATRLRDALDTFIREQDQAGEPDGR